MLHLFLKGIIIGLITGMPFGPIGALCLKTTLTNGAAYGLASGLGSSVADSIFASVAALGITIIMHFLTKYHHFVRILGGVVLIIFGLHSVLTRKENTKEIASGKTIIKSFMSTFLLALANPATIFSFLFVFSSYGAKNMGHGFIARSILILGVFSGSLIWWLILILAAGKFNSKLTPKKISAINRVLGYAIICSGIIFIIGTTNYKKYTKPFYVHSKLFEIILHTKHRMPFH